MKIYKKYLFMLLLTYFFMCFPSGTCLADDLEIFGGGLIPYKPNVLIIFDNSGSMQSNGKITDAETVVNNLINTTDGVNFGLMTFNNSNEGGYVIEECKERSTAQKATLTGAITTLANQVRNYSRDEVRNHRTPLAETLAEAGRYFAGLSSWYSTAVYASDTKYLDWYNNGKYVSPIDGACQENSIIVMTDGASTSDDNVNLWATNYLGNQKIGDYDQDGDDSSVDDNGGTDYLDDVAKFIHEVDLRPNWPDPDIPEYSSQTVTVSTIGFQTDSTANALLESTANSTHGGGIYNTAITPEDLAASFSNIIKTVLEVNSAFVAPVVPPDPTNQIDAGDRVFMSYFKPQSNGQWIGNLKAYKFVNGQMLDQYNSAVIGADGYVATNTSSLWSTDYDGPEVDKGGAGALLVNNDSRDIYTYLGQDTDLTVDSNLFTKDTSVNTYLNAAILGVNLADFDSTIDRARGESEAWPLGTIIHSRPVVVAYDQDFTGDGKNDSYVFVGANDGMLHLFNAETGVEEWGFIPPGQLSRLALLSDAEHDYFVDGSPVVETVDVSGVKKKVLIFGERRGGSNYYTLDITDPTSPVWMYRINDILLGGGDAKLGQSWAVPQFTKVRAGGVTREVFLLTGGYDATNQDKDTPDATDTVGRAIYSVRADTGAVFGLNLNGANWLSGGSSVMTHSVLDVTAFDSNDSGYIDRVYAGDLGGKVFAARYLWSSDLWEKFVLLDLPTQYPVDGTNEPLGQKFMNKPEVTIELDGECVYVGSGDREHLLAETDIDALYVVCNDWAKDTNTGQFTTVSSLIDPVVTYNSTITTSAELDANPLADVQNKLVDLTSNKIQTGSVLERNLLQKSLNTGKGWFLRMENTGEKITSSPKVLNGKIFFTTFAPLGTSSPEDYCTNEADLGEARLYVLDYKTGMAVYDFTEDGNMTAADRSLKIGTSVAYDPVFVTTGNVTNLLTGAGGKLIKIPVETTNIVRRYFWHQVK